MHGFVARLSFMACLVVAPLAHAVEFRFNGFGDVTFGQNFGGPVDKEGRQLWSGAAPLNQNQWFGMVGIDLVMVASITEELSVLSEFNIQAARAERTEIEFDPERVMLNYDFSDKLKFTAGLYFTPIGYQNRFQYSRAWLMRSVQVPDLFEEELNLVPTHTVGVMAHGTFELPNENFLNYALSVGNGRAHAPDMSVFARDFNNQPELTAMVEWNIGGFREFRVGLSGWTDEMNSWRVDNIGDEVDKATGQKLRVRDVGVNPYIVMNSRYWGFQLEHVVSMQFDSEDTSGQPYVMHGGMYEVYGNFLEDRLHPYVRFDFTSLPQNAGLFLGLRDNGDTISRVYIPEFAGAMAGVAYDFNLNLRVKLEYGLRFRGINDAHSVVAQVAYGF